MLWQSPPPEPTGDQTEVLSTLIFFLLYGFGGAAAIIAP